MSNLDDLRRQINQDETDDDEAGLSFEQATEMGLDINEDAPAAPRDPKFLGMSAAERAGLSVLMFLCVLVIGLGLLLATGRIAL